MSLYTIRPLDDRTGFKGKPKRSQFDSSWGSTRSLLATELRHLAAKDVILEVDCLPGAIRLDGELYANARVQSPAVRLHFDSKHGHITYETDAFTHWQDNVRAIALGLEALRKVDRYQLGRGGEQYRGYLALEAGNGATALGAEPAMSRDQAVAALARHAYDVGVAVDALNSGDPDVMRRVHRRARAKSHPDLNGGDQTEWDNVDKAAKVLGIA